MTCVQMFEDRNGRLMMADEIDELSPYEIEELQIHVYESRIPEYW